MRFRDPDAEKRFQTAIKLAQEMTKIADLETASDKLEVLEMQSSEPSFWNNPDAAREIMQKIEQLRAHVDEHARLMTMEEDIRAMLEMASEDPAAESEALLILEDLENSLAVLERRRLFAGEHDQACVLMEINSGAGGTESQDWVEMLLRMYLRWAERNNYKVEILSELRGEEAGYKNVSLRISGAYAYGQLKSENGVHRLVRISPFDSNARRHTSFASVFSMPELDDDVAIDIDEKDLRVDTYRASGAGGQHVNKTDSAVRLTHIPTGIVVSCQIDRSQHKNRATAMKMLQSKLFERAERERQAAVEAMSADKQDIGWGSQIRSYVLHPYKMVKDHRTNFERGDAERVLDGDLTAFIDSYLRWDAGRHKPINALQ